MLILRGETDTIPPLYRAIRSRAQELANERGIPIHRNTRFSVIEELEMDARNELYEEYFDNANRFADELGIPREGDARDNFVLNFMENPRYRIR